MNVKNKCQYYCNVRIFQITIYSSGAVSDRQSSELRVYHSPFVITYANPYSKIGWWWVICITPVWLFLSSSITHKYLSSDSYLSLLPNQSINICNNCDYGNLWLYNHWDTGGNWFQFLFFLVRDSTYSTAGLHLAVMKAWLWTLLRERAQVLSRESSPFRSILPKAFCQRHSA